MVICWCFKLSVCSTCPVINRLELSCPFTHVTNTFIINQHKHITHISTFNLCILDMAAPGDYYDYDPGVLLVPPKCPPYSFIILIM